MNERHDQEEPEGKTMAKDDPTALDPRDVNFQPASEERLIDIASKFAGFIMAGEIKVQLPEPREEPAAESAAAETGGEP